VPDIFIGIKPFVDFIDNSL